MWVLAIQGQSKIRSLSTPSDEAFCLLVLKNSWDLWTWECKNPNVTIPFRLQNAPNVLYTSSRSGRRTEAHGGWGQEGISLYNTLVDELTNNRKKSDDETLVDMNGLKKTKME